MDAPLGRIAEATTPVARTIERQWDEAAALHREAPDPMFLLDRQGIVRRAAGPVAHVEGKRFLDLVPREARYDVALSIQDALSPGLARSFDVQLEVGSEARWFQASAYPVREGDLIVGIILRTLDVTSRRREEERLRRRESLMSDAEGTAHLGTWEWDVTQPVASWSPELYRIYGLDPATHTPTYQDYLTRVHPDDRQRVIEATESVFRDHEPFSHDERVFRSDGEIRYLHTWAQAVVDDRGRLQRLLGVCQDITDRKRVELALAESESRFRAIFNRSALGIATLDPAGRIEEANPAFEALLSTEEIVGRSLFDFTHPDDRSRDRRLLGRLLLDPGEARTVETRFLRPDGHVVWARVTLSPVLPAEPRKPFMVAMVEDVTARRASEEASRVAAERLLRIQTLEGESAWKSRVLTMASHELKNPLTPILLQIHLLREGRRGPVTDEQSRALTMIDAQARRLSALLGDFLDVARIEQGRLFVSPRNADLVTVLAAIEEMYAPLAAERKLTFEVVAPATLTAHFDPDRIQQVLENLVVNALKFTPAEGRVRIRAAKDAAGGAVIEVEDTGPGIPADLLESSFRPFMRTADRERSRAAGTGIGLYIARSLVEAHRGTITARNRDEGGAVFRVVLPPA
ncbi:MAG TPA: PAS domain S-box protein [Candidatus Thermoplasmatota archaeon]|nr:PAS domain S-box protein [Candidatus Thermoplasmatota archaeon]